MKTIKQESILAFIALMLFTYSINAQTWEEIGFNLPDGDTASYNTLITFTNEDIGWVFTYTDNMYKLFKTINGGQNWQKIITINRDFSPYFATTIFSREPDFFYMMNSDPLSAGNYARFTTDGGITWDSTEISNEGFRIIHFYTEEKGNAISGSNSWITTDRGRTWDKKGAVIFETDIYYHDERLGWMVGIGPNNDGGHIAKTTDGGSIWEYATDYFPELNGITFIDSLKGFAVGASAGGGYFITTDGGVNWQSSPAPKMYGFDLDFLNDKDGWVTQWEQIQRTSDGGETWINQLSGYEGYQFIKIIILKKDKVAYVQGANPDNNTATLLKADLSNITGVEVNKEAIPNKFYLYQNHPNPFNPTTTINFEIPTDGYVTLRVYDVLGKEIATLVNERKLAGVYKMNFDGSRLASGVYIARLTAGNFTAALKMILQK